MNLRAVQPALAAQAGIALVVFATAAACIFVLTQDTATSLEGGLPRQGGLPAIVAWAAMYLASWTLMTGAMMLPSSVGFLNVVQRLGGSTAAAFAAVSYTAVWIAVGAVQWGALWLAGDALTWMGPDVAEKLAGATLVLTGLFHASPIASSCQHVCARPFAMLARHVGRRTNSRLSGFAAAGTHYGITCVGCCFPMLAVMFVVGTHHLGWLLGMLLAMGVIKHAVLGKLFMRPAAVALAVAGICIGTGWWPVPLRSLRSLCADLSSTLPFVPGGLAQVLGT